MRGEAVDWEALLSGFVATVDWPACGFWRELSRANHGSWVLLSTRESPQRWWESMAQTIIPRLEQPPPADEPETARRRRMTRALLSERFSPQWRDRDAAIAAYERHNDEVRREVGRERLIDWQPSEGWGPICSALRLEIPDHPFPHVNTSKEFRSSQAAADE